MKIIETKNVVKTFEKHRALSGVSISAEEGKIFGLLGPNGAGKTTLIRIINQITAPDSGEVLFRGEKLKRSDISQIGYLPEERGLYKKMKVGEQALYFAQLKGMKKNDAIAKLKHWFTKFEIQAWWDKKVEELSKGMQQKVQFITTVLHQPKLLIFDEPFSGFDPINTELLKKEILQLKEEGASIIFSTHNMASVEEICDNIALINKSEKILDGSVADIKEKFKSNTYELVFKGQYNKHAASLTAEYKIVNVEQIDNNSIVKVKMLNGNSPNDLLKFMLPFGNIMSFNEIVPSMNDIFIQTVGATGKENKE